MSLEFHLRYAPLVLKQTHDKEGSVGEARDMERHGLEPLTFFLSLCFSHKRGHFRVINKVFRNRLLLY
ncbi:Uncharacterized protein DAT39_020857 [Clarias magur]|uniref:Uncharacterized protein n=1 Tax=Clarias magur TaxID=1594786 RepID=A0A8J4WST3_CLAMG|nr:Uncharacterized protein DAT39_020857 [Clarias magur]